MKAYLDAQKGTVLVGDIQAHMLKEHAKPSTRRQDIIHPSEMAKTGWCPLSTFLRIKAAREADNPYLKASESVGVQLLNIFDEGHLIHDKWQKRLWDMGDLYGNWYCNYCDKVYKNLQAPTECPGCGFGKKMLIYREVPLRAEQYLISGHADGAIPRLDSLIEVKSVGAGTARIEAPDIYKKNTDGQMTDLRGLWADIREPFPAHVKQGQLYLALCDLRGLPYSQIIFIYEAKFNQGVKEFAVKYDPKIAEPLLAEAAAIVAALKGLGPAPECPSGSTCKDCEQYGAEKFNHDRMERQVREDGSQSPFQALRGTTGPTRKIIRDI